MCAIGVCTFMFVVCMLFCKMCRCCLYDFCFCVCNVYRMFSDLCICVVLELCVCVFGVCMSVCYVYLLMFVCDS